MIIAHKIKHFFFVSFTVIFTSFCFTVGANLSYAQTPRPADVMKSLERDQKMATPPEKPKAPPVIQKEQLPKARVKAPAGKKIAIKKIIVDGNTLIPQAQIDAITAPNEGKSLNLEDLGMIAEIITAKFRENGYILVYAYLPAQEVKDGVVHYRVVEGKVGEIQVAREKPAGYFSYSDAFVKRYIRTVLQDPSVREDTLERSLILLNDYNGLTTKATLKRGKAPGTTDIVANVTEQFPWAASIFYDDFGSKTTGKNRMGIGLDVGNLATSGDMFLLRGVAGIDTFNLNGLSYGRADYVVPVGGWGTKAGVYYTNSLYTAGQELELLDIKGKANIAGVYLTHPLIKQRNEEFSVKIGFDYKNIFEYLGGDDTQTKTDNIRVFSLAFTYDVLDRFLGRNIITAGVYQGITGLMGGSRNGDDKLSKTGGQVNFTKTVVDVMRVQKLPGYNHLILRANNQYSSDVLLVAEQYSIGGMGTVRGYVPSAATGDKGYTCSAELLLSPFFPETEIKKHKLGDIFKLAAFIDHGSVIKNKPLAGEGSEWQTGVGGGVRLYWGRNFTFRFDVAVPRDIEGHFKYENNITYLQAVMSF